MSTARNISAAVVLITLSSFSKSGMAQDEGVDFKRASPPTVKLQYPVAKSPLMRKGHWSLELKPGATEMRDGVLFEQGTTFNHPLAITGVATQPPDDLLSNMQRFDDLDSAERKAVQDRLREWYGHYVGQHLPKGGQDSLVHLYKATAARVDSLIGKSNASDVPKMSAAKAAELQGAIVRVVADFLISERRIIGQDPKGQLARYRKRLPPLRVIDDRTYNYVEGELSRFLTGRYIKIEAKKLRTPIKTNARYRAEPADRAGAFVIVPRIEIPEAIKNLLKNNICLREGTRTRRVVIEGPVSIGSEGRVFVAEHPVTGNTWEDIGLENFYHTSVVGGLWEIVQTRVRDSTYSCEGMGATPEFKGWSEQVTTQPRFNSWVVADGCAGHYEVGDQLTPAKVFGGVGVSADNVMKALKGVTADGDGKRCRTRYAAFPTGTYGVDWVCHQNCNAFAHAKWNIAPIYYAVSWVPFGTYGNLGITDIKAACQCPPGNGANHACVPGKACCFNNTFGGGSGWGRGLSSGWHPTKGWIDTEAKFNSHAVPIYGPDGATTVVEVSTQVVVEMP